jgi:hypothetical protein
MSFDKPTRNKLAAMVGECRRLLTEDIRGQLQAVYGLQPDGAALPIERLAHLDDPGREIARELREWQEHLASTEIGTEAERSKSAFDRAVRETAFTVLNRLAALRMCEERGHAIECVRRGMESDGFVLYERLSGGVFGTRGETYRIFLDHMVDELAVDLGVLFDRRAPQSLVFPRERCLEEVLSLLNSQELALLWREDETIGWIYQYFNSKEEREEMRKKSPVPRNSRELAVRNQFFTPRYVVEFLVDNTVARMWYEMRTGDTSLTDVCHYLVHRPTEIFLKEKEPSPASANGEGTLPQEELVRRPVYIPYRPKKDPRDLKILDPACGSGHFLLYAFDLLETIYKEAWADEEPVKSEATGMTLREDYADPDSLHRSLPELILRHNLHGIDIDLRACQIAALALWLRAQRAYQHLGLTPRDRPKITKSNIVCAEPMPGERQLLDQFVADLQPKVLGQLVQVVFEKMKLAGEAGSLLKIEEEIADTVADAKKKWLAGPKAEQTVLFGDLRPQQSEFGFDFSGVDNETFWERAEGRIYTELQRYAEGAENGHGYQRRLFAEDAAQGFAFIDLCRKRYDAVLTNPPFGVMGDAVYRYAVENWPNSYCDFGIAFMDRGTRWASDQGYVGAITSRSYMSVKEAETFRRAVAIPTLKLLVDLGLDVMDGAWVDSCCQILVKNAANPAIEFVNARDTDLTPELLLDSHRFVMRRRADFKRFPRARLSYQLEGGLECLLATGDDGIEDLGISLVRSGCTTFEDERFRRLWWEVAAQDIGVAKTWCYFAKSSEFNLFYYTYENVVKWAGSGDELAERNRQVNGQTAQARQGSSFYFRPGLSFSRRGEPTIAFRVHPAGCMFSTNGVVVLPNDMGNAGYLLGLLNSSWVRAAIHTQAHKFSYSVGHAKTIKWIEPSDSNRSIVESSARFILAAKRARFSKDERDSYFALPFAAATDSLRGEFEQLQTGLSSIQEEMANAMTQIDAALAETYKVLVDDVEFANFNTSVHDVVDPRNIPYETCEEMVAAVVSYVVGIVFGRWDIRFATDEKPIPELPNPFARIPVCPPGMLQSEEGLPLTEQAVRRLEMAGQWEYPIQIPWHGIVGGDAGTEGTHAHNDDLVRLIQAILTLIWKSCAETKEQEACEILGVKTLREYLRKPGLFFADHLKRYSKSGRHAPIYWPLSTASGSYILWIYYHRLNDDSLYTALNMYVKPKIDATEKELNRIGSELPQATGREASDLRSAFERTSTLLDELREFRDELARVAELPYKPNLNDGVLITASPLWKLFRLPKWRMELQECWKKLEAGEYDWANLAYSIWPNRVREICKQDRSIAIAHGLEDLCEVTAKPAKRKRAQKEEIEEALLGEED